MAILDRSQSPWVADRDQDQFLGISLPLEFDMNNPTRTTLEAVKQNVLNLCSTELGERVMQPNLGIRLRRFLFEQFNEDIMLQVQDVVVESINFWLPFININSIVVKMSDNQSGDFKSVMEISINFSLTQNPSANDSVQVTIGE